MTAQQLADKIDDYNHTIYAIIGFTNFYRYDDATRTERSDVCVFQGRRLDPSADTRQRLQEHAPQYLTPDLGVYLPNGTGVLGEVKKSFPAEQIYWRSDFDQLMAYDDDLVGWPSESERVSAHDIVLLVHQGRAVAVRRYLEQHQDEISFVRPFAIVQFNRTDERRAYFFFQRVHGRLSDAALDQRLEDGVPVPMDVFLDKYSTIKLYDSEPPLPYLIDLIWTHVVLPIAADMPRYATLARNQTLEVDVPVSQIVDDLHNGFSFTRMGCDAGPRQPAFPLREWVVRACTKLVLLGEALWTSPERHTIRVLFRRLDDVLAHFVQRCAGEPDAPNQLPLFGDTSRGQSESENGASG